MRLRRSGPAAGRSRPTLGRSSTIRRRRWVAAGAMLALVLAIAFAFAGGSGGGGPRYVPSGGGVASVIAPQPVTHAPRTTVRLTGFRPLPAALSLAATVPLERQVSQLFMVTLDGKGSGAVSSLGSLDWGGVVLDSSNFSSDAQVSALAGAVKAFARSAGHFAPLLAATQEGGPETAFRDLPPEAQPVIGASGEVGVAGAQALRAGERLRALGFDMTLAPLADVDTPGGPLSGRLFSADPAAVARLSGAAVDAYARAGLISAIGHFPGSGGASADPDQMTATVGGSLDQLRSRDLVPFAAVAPKAPVIVMSNAAYAAFDGVTPAALLGQAVDLLRRGYGFQGVVMTDDLDATLQPTGSDPGSVAVQALQAGDDLLFISGPPSEHQQAYDGVLAAARKSAAVRSRVRDALLRVLSLKERYGILH